MSERIQHKQPTKKKAATTKGHRQIRNKVHKGLLVSSCSQIRFSPTPDSLMLRTAIWLQRKKHKEVALIAVSTFQVKQSW